MARRYALIAALMLGGCALMPGAADKQRRSDWLGRNAHAPQEIQRAVALGQIMKGMTMDQVRASWGDPCSYCRGTRRTSEGQWWEYNVFGSGSYGAGNGKHLHFDNSGVLDYWSN